MDNELLDGFCLGDIRVEPLTGTIVRDGNKIHLPSKSAEVLLWLAKNPRRLVERQELLERVWGGGQGSDESLNHAITDIRHALGDKTGAPRFIQTVPTRGYRLLVQPRVDHEPAAIDDAPDDQRPFWQELIRHGVVQAVFAYTVIGWGLIQVAGETFINLGLPAWTVPFVTFVVVGGFPVVILLSWFLEMTEGKMVLDSGQHEGGAWKGLSRNYVAIIAAYAIAAIGSTVYQVSVGFSSPAAVATTAVTTGTDQNAQDDDLIPIAENSIAILKFANIDGTDATQVFANGLSEDILDRVARVPGLLVSARGDSWSLPENATSQEVRRRLRVAYYVEGSVRIEENDITVVAQLIKSSDGFHLTSKPVERKLTRIGEIQDEITGLIVAELRVSLPEDIQQNTVLPPDETDSEADVDAYVQFRRGRDIMDMPWSLESIESAAAYFREALEIDPQFAAAHAGLCGTYTARFEVAGSLPDIDIAEGSCNEALATAPRLAVVHRAAGNFYFQAGRMEDAEREFRNAIELNSRDADAVLGLAKVMQRLQRNQDAENLITQTIELQPGNWRAYNALGALQFSIGEYRKAAESYRRVEYLQPQNFIALSNMATARMMSGEFENARDIFERTLEIETTPIALSNLGILYYYLGDFSRSVEYHEQSLADAPDSESSWINLADALHFAGRRDEATEAFRTAAELADARRRTDPTNPETLTYLAWAETMTGNLAAGMQFSARAVELAPDDPYSYYYLGIVELRNGNADSAMEAIARAADLGYSRVMLAAEPYLEPLRGRPEFSALLSE